MKKLNYLELGQIALKQAGLKLTKPRLQVLNFLANQKKALTPYEIRDELAKSGEKADVVTIYRVLEDLEKLALVHKVLALGRFIRCDSEGLEAHCKDDHGCHHYLICQNCNNVEEIAGENLHSLEEKIEKENQFKIFSHSLEFLGLCKKCNKLLSKSKSI